MLKNIIVHLVETAIVDRNVLCVWGKMGGGVFKFKKLRANRLWKLFLGLLIELEPGFRYTIYLEPAKVWNGIWQTSFSN